MPGNPGDLTSAGHIVEAMARLHREGCHDHATADVEQITWRPAQSVEQYVAANPDLFY